MLNDNLQFVWYTNIGLRVTEKWGAFGFQFDNLVIIYDETSIIENFRFVQAISLWDTRGQTGELRF